MTDILPKVKVGFELITSEGSKSSSSIAFGKEVAAT
jgi:hypothetical protein